MIFVRSKEEVQAQFIDDLYAQMEKAVEELHHEVGIVPVAEYLLRVVGYEIVDSIATATEDTDDAIVKLLDSAMKDSKKIVGALRKLETVETKEEKQ